MGSQKVVFVGHAKSRMNLSHKIVTVYYVITYLDGWEKKPKPEF